MRRNRLKTHFDRPHDVMRRPRARKAAQLQYDFCTALAKAYGWPRENAPIVVRAMRAAAHIVLERLD